MVTPLRPARFTAGRHVRSEKAVRRIGSPSSVVKMNGVPPVSPDTDLDAKSRRALEDRVRPPQLAVLPLQFSQPRPLIGGQARRRAGVNARLLHPVPQ